MHKRSAYHIFQWGRFGEEELFYMTEQDHLSSLQCRMQLYEVSMNVFTHLRQLLTHFRHNTCQHLQMQSFSIHKCFTFYYFVYICSVRITKVKQVLKKYHILLVLRYCILLSKMIKGHHGHQKKLNQTGINPRSQAIILPNLKKFLPAVTEI